MGIIKLFPARESLVSDIPAGDGKTANLFFTVDDGIVLCIFLYAHYFSMTTVLETGSDLLQYVSFVKVGLVHTGIPEINEEMLRR
jgi:hypothetical protein